MDADIEFAYTHGLDDEDVERYLRETPTGVLALADGDEAYAVPLVHEYRDGSLYFHLGDHPGSAKLSFADATTTATYVVYGAEPTDDPEALTSWSVLARGDLRAVPDDDPAWDAVAINEAFEPLRIFDEAVEDVSVELWELQIESLTGRTT